MDPIRFHVDVAALAQFVAYIGGPALIAYAACQFVRWVREEQVLLQQEQEAARRPKPPPPVPQEHALKRLLDSIHPNIHLVAEMLWHQLWREDLLREGRPTEGVAVTAHDERCRTWKCGHYGPAGYEVFFFGERASPPAAAFYEGLFCHRCFVLGIATQSIRCARCGGIIAAGDDVAADYSSAPPLVNIGSATPMGEFLACNRPNCASANPGRIIGMWNGRSVTPSVTIADMARRDTERRMAEEPPPVSTEVAQRWSQVPLGGPKEHKKVLH